MPSRGIVLLKLTVESLKEMIPARTFELEFELDFFLQAEKVKTINKALSPLIIVNLLVIGVRV
jgi:hypothetical protein